MQTSRLFKVLSVIVLLSMLIAACAPTPAATPAPQQPAAQEPAKKDVELTFVWHSGGLGEKLEEIAKEYTKLTGVVVRADLVPYGPQWHDKIAAEFAARGSGFDLAVFDSQSMSEFASQDHVVQLNDYLTKSDKIKLADFEDAALRQYGEYPEGSGKIFALPVNQDSMGLVYRKDLFEDAKEKEAFKAKYGYDLAVPETYDQLKDISEFFTRPDKNMYGLASYGSRDYDAVTSPFDGILWSFGGELWDPSTKKAEGVINSDTAVKALTYYRDLFKYMPPGASGWFYDEVNNAVHTGIVAMAINWYYFFQAHADPKINPFADKLGYATLPGQKAADGKIVRGISVGGQGLSISKYSRNVEEAWKFLEWFMQQDQQWKWVEAGAQTGRVDILKDAKYSTTKPWNATFPNSMSFVKDYWHLVEYPQLLDIYQKYVSLAVSNEMDPKTALDNVAKEQQPILDKIK